MLLSTEIGSTIVYLRKQLGITQEQLALDSEISVARLRDIEHGLANPTLDMLECIARSLKVPLPLLGIILMEDDEILSMIHSTRGEIGLDENAAAM